MSRKLRKPSDLKRKISQRAPYDRVLIVCEGEKTELIYFNDLIDYYELSTANVAVLSFGSAPSSVVEHAKKMQQKEKNNGDEYDKVYCVFDRDEHPSFDAASKKLKDNKFHAARSWPCFEFWLLLHYKYQRSPFSRQSDKTAAKLCESALKKELPAYEKGMKNIFILLAIQITGRRQMREPHEHRQTQCDWGEREPPTMLWFEWRVVYGPNAGGKSNLIKALVTMQEIVITSSQNLERLL